MSTESIFFILAGLAYLTSAVLYFRKAINELAHIESPAKIEKHAEIKSNNTKAKVYYLASASR